MKGRRNKPEQIIPKLREAEVELAQGLTVAEVRRIQRRLFADRGELRVIRVAPPHAIAPPNFSLRSCSPPRRRPSTFPLPVALL